MTQQGTVKYPYYKTNGNPTTRGLRNKRKSHQRKLREAELRKLRWKEMQESEQRYRNYSQSGKKD
jgi:hypothetical protein